MAKTMSNVFEVYLSLLCLFTRAAGEKFVALSPLIEEELTAALCWNEEDRIASSKSVNFTPQ